MTSDAEHPFALSGRDFLKSPSLRERAQSLKLARRHTKIVTRLRIALPILAACIGALYFFSPKLHVTVGNMDASVASVVIEKGNLRMLNPKLEGVSESKGVYVVTAKYAEQTIANPDIIHLTEIKAEINNPKQGWSRLSAPKGTFTTQTEKLELIGDIRTAQSSGMTARLSRASIDMKRQIIVSNEPVDVDFLNGTVRSDQMTIFTDKKTVIFRDRVLVHIRKRPENSNSKAKQ